MYLNHFALSEHPFDHQKDSDLFFEGGDRAATLDALIYLLTHGEGVEGIVKVTGEGGSGKTTLCRLLMQRLPPSAELLHFAPRDLSRKEFLHSLAEKLNFEPTGIHTAANDGIGEPGNESEDELQDELHRTLTRMTSAGAQFVLLMDEAHALPEETLEAVCTLYGLQASQHKSFQIVLFGQPHLDETLAKPHMRKVRAQISQHFSLKPFTAKAVKNYLTWRLHAAGCYGSEMFSPGAIRSITMASQGGIPQLDALAANALRIAYHAKSPLVDGSHVKAAIKDAGIKDGLSWRGWRLAQDLPERGIGRAGKIVSITPLALVVVLAWNISQRPATSNSATIAPIPFEASVSAPLQVSAPSSVYPATVAAVIPSASPSARVAPVPSNPSNAAVETKADTPGFGAGMSSAPVAQRSATASIGGVKLSGYELLGQRVEATLKAVGATNRDTYTVQLFATDNVQPDRMERFLARARGLVNLSDLYVHPVTNGESAKFRVTYGIYASRDQASVAMAALPEKYQTSFHPEIYALSEIR